MNSGRNIFAQVMDFLPRKEFAKCVERYEGNKHERSLSCWDQFLCMAFAQLTYRESLRDIEVCLRAIPNKRYHMGIKGSVARSTIAEANESRDWRIYADFAQVLISQARELYTGDDAGLDLDETIYALDSSTIDLFSLFPWAKFRKTKAAVKLHTLLDLKGSIPAWIFIVHDVNILDYLLPEAGSFYRGYLDFSRLYKINLSHAYFVIRAKTNTKFQRQYSNPVDRITQDYPDKLRRIKFNDDETGKTFVFITNNLLPAFTITQLYKCRWKVELFFKWIKQHLRIKKFYGTSENAVKTQIWIAISVYVLVAIMKKRLKINSELYTILQILSLTLFEKSPLFQTLANYTYTSPKTLLANQMFLFND